MAEPLSPEIKRVAVVVVVGAIMSILDTTIVNVALESLSRDLHAPLSTVQWVATGYLLALATVIPLTGWAAENFGPRRVWMTVVTAFVITSGLCGLAWSAESLIAFRVRASAGPAADRRAMVQERRWVCSEAWAGCPGAGGSWTQRGRSSSEREWSSSEQASSWSEPGWSWS